MDKIIYLIAIVISASTIFSAKASEDINMVEVRKLSKLPVSDIIDDPPVKSFQVENYWQNVHGRDKPLVVFFYSNNDGPSQRLATLIKYIAIHYMGKISFGCVKVVEEGKPDKNIAKKFQSLYSLDSTPGILFYDNVGKEMVLEDEDYIDADFREFRSPKMVLWKTYYSAVLKELDKLLGD